MNDVFTKLYQDAIERDDTLLKAFLDNYHLKDEEIKKLSDSLRVREEQIKRACMAIELIKANPDKIDEIYEKWDLGYEINISSG